MPIKPIPFITLHTENGNKNEEEEREGEEHFRFEINEEAARILQSIDEPVSVCLFLLLVINYYLFLLFLSSLFYYLFIPATPHLLISYTLIMIIVFY